MTAVNIIGLIVAVAALIFLICKGFNAVISSIVAALIAGLTNGFGIWETLKDYYVPGFLGFAGKMFFVFLLATMYGKVIGASGSAHRIAYTCTNILGKKRAILVVGITTGVLVYGGVSAMVVVFTVLPIAFILFKESDVPKILLPATITWGQATFAMAALPGSPQNPNIVPGAILGTNIMSGPVLGLIAGVIMFVLGWIYLEWQFKFYQKKGIGFDPNAKINMKMDKDIDITDCPPAWKAFLPLIILIILNLCFNKGVFGEPMDSITSVNTSMVISIAVVFLLNPSKFNKIFTAFVEGSTEWFLPLFNFTCMIAFGNVVTSSNGFSVIAAALLALPGSVYVSALVTTGMMCGITGNGSGGETIALNAMADKWITAGANPAVLHRIVSITSSTFDSLPHCGGITTVYGLCDESVGKGYKHAFVTTVIVPLIAAVAAVALACLGVV